MALFDFFTGASQRRDLEDAALAATRARRAGVTEATGELTGARDTAIETLQPDLAAGTGAQEQLLTAIGLRGEGAQRQFFTDFETDPGFEAETQAGLDALGRSASARGMTFSGRTLKELSEFGALRKRSAFQDRLDRLTSLASLGSQTRTNVANLQFGTGGQLADIAFGTGQQEAAQALNLGNVRAESRGIPISNLVELGKVGAKIAGAF